MRVLQLTGPIEGGIRKHVEALLCELPGQGVEAALAGPAPVGGPGVPWSPVPLTDRALSALSPRNLLALSAARRRTRAELMHAHGYKAAALAGLASVSSSAGPYVVTLHNLCPPLSNSSRALLRLALSRAQACLFVSEAIRESLAANEFSAGDGRVIPNGIDWQRFAALPEREQTRAALGLAGEPVALFLGRLTEEKGVHVLAEAAALLQQRGERWYFLLAGEGPERSRLLTQSAAEEGAMRLLGHREDIPALLAACDTVVVPSLREGQSLAALEALAAGRPLLVSDVGGLAALARASGAAWTAPPGDAAALATTLLQLRAQPREREERVARGRAYVRAAGDWSAMAARVAAVYREVTQR
jgi:glycosyltransferase involved in cell wall biosynthesis